MQHETTVIAAQEPAPPPATQPTAPACANCGAALVGRYCAHCGQRADNRLISLRQILADTLEDQFSWNAAFPRTVKALLLHPGRLTTEYVSGRIATYIPPMRLYLAASVLFFLAFAAVPDPPTEIRETHPSAQASSARAGTGPAADVPAKAPGAARRSAVSSWPPLLQAGVDRLKAGMARIKALPAAEQERALAAGFAQTAPKILFLMVPVFAALLKLLYLRHRRLYVEHFIFALHTHSIAFLGLLPLLLLHYRPLNAAIYLWLAGYTLVAMHAVYGQSWARTGIKFALLSFSYMVVLALGMTAAMLMAIMSLGAPSA